MNVGIGIRILEGVYWEKLRDCKTWKTKMLHISKCIFSSGCYWTKRSKCCTCRESWRLVYACLYSFCWRTLNCHWPSRTENEERVPPNDFEAPCIDILRRVRICKKVSLLAKVGSATFKSLVLLDTSMQNNICYLKILNMVRVRTYVVACTEKAIIWISFASIPRNNLRKLST